MTTTALRTFIEADVKCFHCGQMVGVTRQNKEPAPARSTFIAAGSTVEVTLKRLASLHCPRCGGPSYVDEFQTRYEFPPIEFNDEAPRRGRPPKRLLEMRQGAA
ncbi:MAG: hypothetical protein ACKVVP_07745 [Chloroflexota bacterium]